MKSIGGNETIRYIQFRYKFNGWWKHGLRMQFLHEDYYSPTRGGDDPYMKNFIQRNTLNLTCENCQYRKKEHYGDFYIGDAWNINRIRKNMDDNMGITTVLANSNKAIQIIKKLQDAYNHNIFEISVDEALYARPDILNSFNNSVVRDKFFRDFVDKGFKYAVENTMDI